MPFFTTLDPKRLAEEIGRATQRIVIACAGIQKPVADALLAAHERLPGAVKVVLDVAPGVARLGYGDFECVQRLHDAELDVRHQNGLRIGVLICDAHGWTFTSAARLVEADPTTDVDAFNAIALTEAQILQLCSELPATAAPSPAIATGSPPAGAAPVGRDDVLSTPGADRAKVAPSSARHPECDVAQPPVRDAEGQMNPPADTPASTNDAARSPTPPTVGASDMPPLVGEQKVDAEQLKATAENLELAPPQPFDLARQANMYSALVQFVELELQGFKFESRRITLPKTLPVIASENKDVKARLSASFKFLEQAVPADVKAIDRELEELRKAYLIPVGRAGRIILASKRKEFEDQLQTLSGRLDKQRKALADALDAKIAEVVDALVPELARAVLADPPPGFRGRYPTSKDAAGEFVIRELKGRLPNATALTANMRIHCLFKDVTYAMLKDKDFCTRVRDVLPESVLQSGLLTEQTVARSARSA